VDERVEDDGRLLRLTLVGLSLVADGIDAFVGALALGLLLDLLGGVALLEVDRDGADFFGLLEPLGHTVDDEDLGGTADERRVSGHQADRTSAKDADALAGRDACQLAAVVAGGEDVGQEDEVCLELLPLRKLEAVEVRVRDAKVLGLTARVRAHRHIAVRATGEAWVDGEAEARVAGEAVLAEAAGDVEGHDHAVALPDRGDCIADLLDDAEVFVPEDDPGLRGRAALIHVQVGAADGRRRNADDDVVRMFDPRVINLLDRDLERLLVDNSLHRDLLREALGVALPMD
jgi:hypothetical protein